MFFSSTVLIMSVHCCRLAAYFQVYVTTDLAVSSVEQQLQNFPESERMGVRGTYNDINLARAFQSISGEWKTDKELHFILQVSWNCNLLCLTRCLICICYSNKKAGYLQPSAKDTTLSILPVLSKQQRPVAK